MICKSYNKFFEVFANKTRLKIIKALQISNRSVTEICEKIGEEQSKVSHNLKVLSDCSFVTCSRDGKRRVYALNDETIVPLMDIVDRHVEKNCKICRVKK